MHRILQRFFVGENGEPPVAPTVRVMVLAAGHTALPFGARLSPWARLLDVYSHRYNVLFVVSAGNYDAPIELAEHHAQDLIDRPADLQNVVRGHLFTHAHERRILSPSDSVNSLTVGARHADGAGDAPASSAIDLIGSSNMPSPISAVGGGFNRQMKPEVFASGGRVLYRHRWDIEDRLVFDRVRDGSVSPGLRAATPGGPGVVEAERWIHGTSAAAGLLGHEAGQLVELLADDEDNPFVDDRFLGVAAKALLVNAASWAGAQSDLAAAAGIGHKGKLRDAASRFLGFGFTDLSRVAICTDQRVSVVGTGVMFGEDARLFRFPMPASLSGRPEFRRVSATLSWFSPVNPRNQTYRQARLWFELVNSASFDLRSVEGERLAVRRGTLQHEVFEGSRAVTVAPGADLEFRVSCAKSAGMQSQPVPYAIVCTFEVAAESELPIYQQVASSLRARSDVRAARVRV